MPIHYPTKEAQYLAIDGDVIDRIAWEYYGTERRTTEQILLRNPWVAEHFPVLSAGAIIILPVITKAMMQEVSVNSSAPLVSNGSSSRQLWAYRKPKLWKGSEAQTSLVLGDAAALQAYRASKRGGSVSVATTTDCCEEIHNPEERFSLDWLTTYYRDSITGEWKLGRIHKSLVSIGAGGYSTVDLLSDGLL